MDRPTVPVPAEERCPCGRPLVMGVPCTHHVAPTSGGIIDRAVAMASALRRGGLSDEAQLVGEMVGGIRYDRALIEELRRHVDPETFRRATRAAR